MSLVFKMFAVQKGGIKTNCLITQLLQYGAIDMVKHDRGNLHRQLLFLKRAKNG